MGLLSGMDMPLSHASKLLCEISTITRLCCDLVGAMLFFTCQMFESASKQEFDSGPFIQLKDWDRLGHYPFLELSV